MDAAFPLFLADDTLDEYYQMKPALTQVQADLLNAFYRARRDTPHDSMCTANALSLAAATIPLDNDLCVYILQKVDDEYKAIQLEKIKRASQK